MNTRFKFALCLVASAALGGAAVQVLHAQGKPKAYSITENDVLDAAALATYVPKIQAAQKAAGGRPFNTGGGKMVTFMGEAPKRIAITEWDSLEQAINFRNSAAFKGLAPERDKAVKAIRSYAVEVAPEKPVEGGPARNR
jgi:uncharacterized protein (DUF1330 family)